jgi:putative tryptophan/tyrosine transport system substrate-binding protein
MGYVADALSTASSGLFEANYDKEPLCSLHGNRGREPFLRVIVDRYFSWSYLVGWIVGRITVHKENIVLSICYVSLWLKGMPVIGFLGSTPPGPYAPFVAAFRQGLSEGGYIDGRNVAIEYRWADGHYDRLPALAADLVRQRVAVILATGSTAPALAAKAATAEIPIVFESGGNPVAAGLVASLNRSSGNVTGITVLFSALVPKRLDLLHQLVPKAAVLGALVNPNYPEADLQRRELQEAAKTLGRPIEVQDANTPTEIEAAFAVLVERKTDALLIANDPTFLIRRDQIIALAARHSVPTIYGLRQYADEGGLVSYGPSLTEALRQGGIYVSRILNGAKPAELPVMQPTLFELVINLKTAKTLGLSIPPSLLATADEVIE